MPLVPQRKQGRERMERQAFIIFFLFPQFLNFELIVIVHGVGSSSPLVSAQKNAMIELSRKLPSLLIGSTGDGRSPCEWKGLHPKFFLLLKRAFGIEISLSQLQWVDGSLGNLSAFAAMETLDLSFNNLVGAELALSNNRFHGGIPNDLLSYENLTFLDLNQNHFNGSIPAEIEKLSKLETLLLSSNNLNGEIPISLSKIKNLSRFSANLNEFSGSIPPGIAYHLQFFDLSYNNLSG
ncbi:putative LRR receptor-like serine/threonine-protein kinase [Apostasia shenzhenica]|uniref:Putative LRR receptor-like serine/threonine-protein kinase n=1 Tax=Apostasia shenzhenica TaxID=1088818 RepID=A0A2I0AG58_9ASPA|nr:putative LRR receptor-like serine/threonine-protein kinase [Apostasia shenzhenica]